MEYAVGALKRGDLAAFLLADGRSAFGFRYGFQASWRLIWINWWRLPLSCWATAGLGASSRRNRCGCGSGFCRG